MSRFDDGKVCIHAKPGPNDDFAGLVTCSSCEEQAAIVAVFYDTHNDAVEICERCLWKGLAAMGVA